MPAFIRDKKSSYSNEERLGLAELVAKYKTEFEREKKAKSGQKKYDRKRKIHVSVGKGSFVANAVWEFCSDLTSCPNDDPNFHAATSLATRCLASIDKLRDPSICEPKKKRAAGAGRKQKSPEVREELFFLGLLMSEKALKIVFLSDFFKLKAQEIYSNWLSQNPVPEAEQLKFGNEWVEKWEVEYSVSLRKPNKHYSISYEDLCIRLKYYLQNMWTVRNYFLKKYGVDPPIINGDQIPLHWNESSSQKTLDFKNVETYVKERYSLSWGRAAVFTQVSSDSMANLIPEFVFKGVGTWNQNCCSSTRRNECPVEPKWFLSPWAHAENDPKIAELQHEHVF